MISNKEWTDPDFSINKAIKWTEFIALQDLSIIQKGVTWERARKKIKNSSLLGASIDPNDIIQGQVGDCYFLSGISAIAEYKERFTDIFESKDYPKSGMIAIEGYLRGVK